MAKNKSRTKNKQGKGKKRSKGGSARPLTTAQNYAQLLLDPCDGPVGNRAYAGQQGVSQRFVSDGTAGTLAGHTAGFVAYFPAINGWLSQSGATSATQLVTAWNVAAPLSPGHAYLVSAASKARCHAACMSIIPSTLSINNIVGEWAYGSVSTSEFMAQGGTRSTDEVFSLLSQKSIIQRATLDVKWTPGLFDAKFTDYGVLASADTSDQNCVVIAFRGIPASTAMGLRITSVLEWCPRVGTGLVANATNMSPGINHIGVASILHERTPSWWHTVKENFSQDSAKAVRFLTQSAMAEGGKRAVNYLAGEIESSALMLAL